MFLRSLIRRKRMCQAMDSRTDGLDKFHLRRWLVRPHACPNPWTCVGVLLDVVSLWTDGAHCILFFVVRPWSFSRSHACIFWFGVSFDQMLHLMVGVGSLVVGRRRRTIGWWMPDDPTVHSSTGCPSPSIRSDQSEGSVLPSFLCPDPPGCGSLSWQERTTKRRGT